MEIDITDFVRNAEPCEFSASRAELGNDAGKITWNSAKREAADSPLVSDPDALETVREWFGEFGAWDAEERATWSADDINALLIQFISGDWRELESLCYSDSDEFGIDWQEAQRLSEAGTISGLIFKGDNGRVYFYAGS